MNADIIESQQGPTQDHIPEDFSGMSGAGIYQISVRSNDNQYVIEEVHLARVFVAYKEKSKCLQSRGHISLYDVFCKFLDKQIGL